MPAGKTAHPMTPAIFVSLDFDQASDAWHLVEQLGE